MVNRAKKEYLEAIRKRYARAGRRHKTKILDEFCEVCQHHRKHAIRLLKQEPSKKRDRPGPRRIYMRAAWASGRRVTLPLNCR